MLISSLYWNIETSKLYIPGTSGVKFIDELISSISILLLSIKLFSGTLVNSHINSRSLLSSGISADTLIVSPRATVLFSSEQDIIKAANSIILYF